MEENKSREYVRLKNGLIGQFYSVEEEYDGNIQINFEEFVYEYENIEQFYNDIKHIKHSKNIIDLIEVGDYVNGGYIFEIGNTINGDKWVHTLNGLILYNQEVQTILTHEQFEQNCYKV